jgi:hypothetical protein
MQGGEVLIPITIFAGGFAMIFGIVYLKTRENMAMIEKGMNPKQYANRPAPFKSLKNGLLFFGAGLGLLVASLVDTAKNFHDDNHNVSLYFACIAIGGGLGLIVSYIIEKKEWMTKRGE